MAGSKCCQASSEAKQVSRAVSDHRVFDLQRKFRGEEELGKRKRAGRQRRKRPWVGEEKR